MRTAADNIRKITDATNRIDIGKAAALERNLKLMSEVRTLDGIREVIEHLKEMIGLLMDDREQQIAHQQRMLNQMQNAFQVQPGAGPLLSIPTSNNPVVVTESKKSDSKKTEIDLLREEYEKVMTLITTSLNGLSAKLGQTLNVRVVNLDGNINRL